MLSGLADFFFKLLGERPADSATSLDVSRKLIKGDSSPLIRLWQGKMETNLRYQSPMYTDFTAAVLLLLSAVPLAAVVVAAGYWAYRQKKLGNEQVSEQR